MTETISFDLFDNRGLFRRDISEQDRASLPPDKLALLVAVEKAADNLANTESQLKSSEDARKVAFDETQKSKLHLDSLRPSTVAQLQNDERRRMMLPESERVRISRLPIAPEIQTALADVVEREDLFEGSKTECRRLQLALTDARGRVAAAVVKWQESFPVISPDQLLRNHVRAEHERRMNGTELAPVQERTILAPIDAYMANGKNPIGVRSARQQNRHPTIAGGKVYPSSMMGMKVAPDAQAPWRVAPLRSHRS